MLPDHEPAHELIFRLVEQIERGAIGFDELGELAQNQLEQIVEVERRAERVAHLLQRARCACLVGECGFELAQALLESSRGRRRSNRHAPIESWNDGGDPPEPWAGRGKAGFRLQASGSRLESGCARPRANLLLKPGARSLDPRAELPGSGRFGRCDRRGWL